jgi:diadenylate cyclase
MLVGLLAIAVAFMISQESILNLSTFNWMLEQVIGNILIIIIVLFQADIRKALAAFGQTRFLSAFRSAQGAHIIDELVKAVTSMARQNIGALIVIEREADLTSFAREGTRIDARVSKELMYTLFVPERQNPLHDGAVLIQHGLITSAGVFLPMTINPSLERSLGTRHRAGVGLTEETDAIVLIVSEERGSVTVAVDGHLSNELSSGELRRVLTDALTRTEGDGDPVSALDQEMEEFGFSTREDRE